MITRTLSLMFLALGLALAAPLFSQQDAGSKLGELMGDFQRTTKKLPTLLEDEPKWEQALAEVCRLQKISIDAKSEVPELVTGIEDEKKRKKARLAYRAKMQEFVRALLDGDGLHQRIEAQLALHHVEPAGGAPEFAQQYTEHVGE